MKPMIMGIVNLTSDSFYKNSRFTSDKELIEKVEGMIRDGMDIIDIGAFSSRPGAKIVSEMEEWDRLQEGLKLIRREFPGLYVSVDTFRSGIAKKSIDEGADIINDISGGDADDGMFDVITKSGIPYILMHMKGTSETMQTLTKYENLLLELIQFFEKRVKKLYQMGHNDIIIDPGIGFSKTIDQNYEILKNLDYFKVLKLPLLVGVSRKSLIYKKFGTTPDEALNGTSVLNTFAVRNGASILRVHDVKEAREVVELANLVTN